MDIEKLFMPYVRSHLEFEKPVRINGKIKACFSIDKEKVDPPKRQRRKRWMILVGNGLCRAFNNSGFGLDSIVEKLEDKNRFRDVNEALQILKTKGKLSTEEALGILQNLSTIREALVDEQEKDVKVAIGGKDNNLLLIKRPQHLHINEYFYEVLKSIRDASNSLFKNCCFQNYSKNIIKFLKSGFEKDIKMDVATLNYDTSLYRSMFREKWVRDAYVDGFLRQKDKNSASRVSTKQEVCRRILNYQKSRYLHLHGSYLFIESSNGFFQKKEVNFFPSKLEEFLNSVIILTNQRKKYRSIKYIDVLDEYNTSFGDSLDKCEKLIIFGYAGRDHYLQETIGACMSRKHPPELLIVLRKGDCLDPWEKLLRDSEDLVQVKTSFDLLYNSEKGCNRILEISDIREFDWPIYSDN